jgi:hypothetical protein
MDEILRARIFKVLREHPDYTQKQIRITFMKEYPEYTEEKFWDAYDKTMDELIMDFSEFMK